MISTYFHTSIVFSISCLVLSSCASFTVSPSYSDSIPVSDLMIVHTGDIHGGLGLDKPYWTDSIRIGGRTYAKGIVLTPESGGRNAFAEFLIPAPGGHLTGVAGWAEEKEERYNGRMRFRIFVDDELKVALELHGEESRKLNVDLGSGTVLRIESDDGGDMNYSDHMAFGDLRIEY